MSRISIRLAEQQRDLTTVLPDLLSVPVEIASTPRAGANAAEMGIANLARVAIYR